MHLSRSRPRHITSNGPKSDQIVPGYADSFHNSGLRLATDQECTLFASDAIRTCWLVAVNLYRTEYYIQPQELPSGLEGGALSPHPPTDHHHGHRHGALHFFLQIYPLLPVDVEHPPDSNPPIIYSKAEDAVRLEMTGGATKVSFALLVGHALLLLATLVAAQQDVNITSTTQIVVANNTAGVPEEFTLPKPFIVCTIPLLPMSDCTLASNASVVRPRLVVRPRKPFPSSAHSLFALRSCCVLM